MLNLCFLRWSKTTLSPSRRVLISGSVVLDHLRKQRFSTGVNIHPGKIHLLHVSFILGGGVLHVYVRACAFSVLENK